MDAFSWMLPRQGVIIEIIIYETKLGLLQAQDVNVKGISRALYREQASQMFLMKDFVDTYLHM